MLIKQVKVTIGKKVFTGLRIKFETDRATLMYAKAVISIYGMSQSSYDALEYDAISRIEVLSDIGYESLFVGNFRYKETRIDDASVVRDIYLFESISTIKDKINVSFDVNTTGRQVIEYFKQKMPMFNFVINEEAQLLIDELRFKGGYVISGVDYYNAVKDFIVDNLNSKYYPSFDNGRVIIGESNKPPVKINANTGMKGIPQFTKRLIKNNDDSEFSGKVTVKLIPRLSIYDKIEIESIYYKTENVDLFVMGKSLTKEQFKAVMQPSNGIYISKRIKSFGDTHGKDWHSEIDFIGILNG